MSTKFAVYFDDITGKWLVKTFQGDVPTSTGKTECLLHKCLYCNTSDAAIQLADLMNRQENGNQTKRRLTPPMSENWGLTLELGPCLTHGSNLIDIFVNQERKGVLK